METASILFLPFFCGLGRKVEIETRPIIIRAGMVLIRYLGYFMSMILLLALSAASDEDYAMVISGDDSYSEYCQDCYPNIITQTDNQMIENVKIGVSDQIFDVGVGDEGLTASILASTGFTRLDSSDTFVIGGFALNGVPGNGIMIADIQAPIILKNITVDSQGVKGQSSEPVGIGMVNSRNVIIEDCTALSGSLFRLSRSDNIRIKNDTAKNIFLEGILNSIVDNCTANCIMIKGAISLFYSDKPKGLTNGTVDDRSVKMPENIIEISKNCTIKNCNRIKEIDLFNAEDCTVESCTMEDVGLWMANARNATVSNTSVVNGTLSIDWSRDLLFQNLTLIDSNISMAGSVPEDFSVAFKDCQVDGMPILYYENQNQLELKDLTAGQIWLRDCPGAHLDGCAAGEVYVIDSDGTVIENSKIDGEGINLVFSEDCVLSNNILSGNESMGE